MPRYWVVTVRAMAPRTAPLARDRVLLTGDAAGLADPVTCEGISFAVASGRLAAQAIAEHFGEPRQVARRYQSSLAREVLGELAAARLVAGLLYGPPAVTRFLFHRAGGPLCHAMAAVLSGRQTYRSLMKRPAAYLSLFRRLLRAA